MMDNPGQSIPKQAGNWADAMGAYRLLSNPGIDPHALQAPHRQLTRDACAAHPIILAVTDITELNFSTHPKTTGLGALTNGAGRGLHQATTFAVSTDGDAIGQLRQHWYKRPSPPKRETRIQRQARWTEVIPRWWRAATPIWLDFFRYGPIEWVWRSLTYWHLQPMRR